MARKENIAEEAGKLMSNRKNIRNMGIVAHVDHGKCVTGEARIVLSDGNAVEARRLFESVAQKGRIANRTSGEVVYSASGNGLRVFSLNKQTGCIEAKRIEYAWKLEGGKVIKVGLRNGAGISTTPEHKYVVLAENGFSERAAAELAVGDSIVCAKNIPVEGSSEEKLKEMILGAIAAEKFYVWLAGGFGSGIKAEIMQLGEGERQILFPGLAPEGVSACLKENRLRSRDLLALCKRFSIPLHVAYDGVATIAYRGGTGRRGKNAKAMTLPQEFDGFFFLAGLLFGDGHEDKFVVGKPVLGEVFVNELSKLGVKPFFRNYAGRTPEISAGSKTLRKLLGVLFDYPAGKKSHSIHATEILFTAPDRCVAAFLKAYFDCDGTVEQARRAVSVSSASYRMLADVQLLLLRFNVASIVQGNCLYVTGNSLKRFNDKIGFSLPEKLGKALALGAAVSGSFVLDAVPLPSSALKTLRGMQSMAGVASNFYEYERKGVKPTLSSLRKIALKLDSRFLDVLCKEQLSFIEVVSLAEAQEKEVFDFTVEDNHNFVANGVVVHNTTLSDSLVALAGLISQDLAGEQRVLDYDEQEQARGITIKAANVSIPYTYEGQPYLINLIDTPGHVDFGGHVTRAMRAVDGVILVIDCVEGIMPQTETVLRQALKEKVKPILFINKIDRLINELKLDATQMQQRFLKIITGVNKLITTFGPPEFKEPWLIDVAKGNVAFGTAFNKWAISGKQMKKSGMTFKDIYQACIDGKHKELNQKIPLGEVMMDMLLNHLPNPLDAQKYRVPVIWHGDLESELGKSMLSVDSAGKACFMVTAIQVDPHAGEVAVGRLYSGTLKKGSDLYLASQYKKEKLQGVAVYMGPDRVMIDEVPAGNIVALVGLKEVYSGETVSEEQITPFEQIKHHSVPVVTKSIEAKNPRDLVKLVEVMKKLAKEDPTIKLEINQDTGEHLMSGMGELHLEIIEYKIRNERGVEIVTSPPIVVYQETVLGESPELEGKSPNKHNKFRIMVKPVEHSVIDAINDGTIDEHKKGKELIELLIKAGMPRDESKSVMAIHNGNFFLDMTKGVQYLQDIKESLITAFEEAMDQGPLAKEKCVGVKVILTDATIHVDPAHRGPAQVFPAIKRPIYAGMLVSKCVLMEPKQKLVVNSPSEYLGNITTKIQGRRGQVENIEQEGEVVTVTAKVPVAEMFGFANEIRGATQGRAAWYYEYAGYERLNPDLQARIQLQIRKRKGEPETAPTAKDFLD